MNVAAEAGELATLWRTLRGARPGVRARDVAAELGVSEAELVASTVGDTAVRLDGDPASLLAALPDVGRCMALTRNEYAVSEVRGRYGGVAITPPTGQVIGEGIDLRVFPAHWRHLFAIDEPHPGRLAARQRSIQVFDRAGVAVHKVYLEPEADAATWDAVVATRLHPEQRAPLAIERDPARSVERADDAVDRSALVADWDAMTDTHEFFGLLRRHDVARTQALRLAGERRARRVGNDALDTVLRQVADTRAPIMIFVGNRGCIQVFSGKVERVVRHGPWLNVLDPGFNLHVRADRIAGSWVVAKPTRTGTVCSLELFDRDGDTIALVFRKRADRERAEDPAWRAALDQLASVSA